MQLKEMRLIMDNYFNGNIKDMSERIIDYGLYDFWSDLKEHLIIEYLNDYIPEFNYKAMFDLYSDIVIAYHKTHYR